MVQASDIRRLAKDLMSPSSPLTSSPIKDKLIDIETPVLEKIEKIEQVLRSLDQGFRYPGQLVQRAFSYLPTVRAGLGYITPGIIANLSPEAQQRLITAALASVGLGGALYRYNRGFKKKVNNAWAGLRDRAGSAAKWVSSPFRAFR